MKRSEAVSVGYEERWAPAHAGREERQESYERVMGRWSRFISDESIDHALAYRPRPEDVFIATHSKAGTTMMQQIVHQLRTGGHTDFEEISLVVPFMEIAHDVGLDLNASQGHTLRAFKTHFDWPSVPKAEVDGKLTGKYIYVARHPVSVIVSMYHFLEGWFFTEEEFPLCDLVELMLYKRSTPVWMHYYEWYQAAQKYPGQILWFFFEDLVGHREACIRRVDEFLELGGTAEERQARIDVATEYSSFEWMKTNEKLFDETPSKRARNEAMGAVGSNASKVRTGKTSVGAMDPLLRQEMEHVIWSQFQELFGVQTYEDWCTLVYNSSVNTFTPTGNK